MLELRTLYGKSKTKQPERLMGVLYTFLIDIGNSNVDVGNQYIHIRGAFSVARFDLQGNAKAFMRGTSDRTGSTFYFVYVKRVITSCVGGHSMIYIML